MQLRVCLSGLFFHFSLVQLNEALHTFSALQDYTYMTTLYTQYEFLHVSSPESQLIAQEVNKHSHSHVICYEKISLMDGKFPKTIHLSLYIVKMRYMLQE